MPGPIPCQPGCACGNHKGRTMPPGNKQERRRGDGRRYREANRELLNEKQKQRAAANPEPIRERQRSEGWRYHIKSKYGITPERWAALLSEQDGRCYLCCEPLILDGPRHLVHIDHDHSCCRGAKSCGDCIRGLACNKCNQGVGQFGDSVERLRRVADNLEAANARVAARKAAKPVQGELPIDIKRAARKTAG